MTIARWRRRLSSVRQRRRWHVGIMLLLAALLQGAAAAAYAHAALIASIPADGEQLQQAPAGIELRFNEDVAPLVFKLLRPDGSSQALTQVSSTPASLYVRLPAGTAPGTYLLSWRAVSTDGHPVGGSLTYMLGSGSSLAPAPTATMATPPAALPALANAIWLSRWLLYGALFTALGASLFRAWIAQPMPKPAAWSYLPLALAAVLLPLCLGLQGLDALALPWRSLGSAAPWRTASATAYGNTIFWLAGALLAALAASRMQAWRARAASLLALGLAALALAVSGHASSAPPAWLARPAVFIHVFAVTCWIGALLPLLRDLRDLRSGRDGSRALRRFSRMIPWAIAALLVSGAVLTLLQLDSPSSLWRTDYGRILSAKLLLVALLLLLGAVNRYRLTARASHAGNDAPTANARRALRRMIGIELLAACMVLALVALWRFTPPPRALASIPAAAANVHLHGSMAMADLSVHTEAGQRVRASIYLQDADFQPLAAQQVTLELSNPALGIQPLQKTARHQQGGRWTIAPFALPAAPHWQVRIRALVSDFEQTELEGTLELPHD